ncbi:MAG: DUF6057 family protein [Tannerellaceae bacterium]|nr:DUF6057 family protein [Tannerellaceae bacterium]
MAGSNLLSNLHYFYSFTFGVFTFLFVFKYIPHHFHYKEQFQLFIFTADYFRETCSTPGGLCNYIGRFFSQFFLHSWMSALTVSFFLAAIQLIMLRVCLKFRSRGDNSSSTGRRFLLLMSGRIADWELYVSFLPSIGYLYFLCDENTQFGGVVALLFSLAYALFLMGGDRGWTGCLLLTLPILYFSIGGIVYLSLLLALLYGFLTKEGKTRRWFCSFLVVGILFAAACPFIAKEMLKQYPLSRYFWGVDYVHFVAFPPFRFICLWLLTLTVVLVGVCFCRIVGRGRLPVAVGGSLFIVMLIYVLVVKTGYVNNVSKEELMAYDHYCRTKNWMAIIQMADKKHPKSPMMVACLNLALYKMGELPNRMFDYFQNGLEGLLPSFRRDFMIATVACEPYYYLGFTNTAQRLAMEGMEALPDGQKSVRSIMRLAETNLIGGRYELASKYLRLLEKTLFYRKWACETREYLYNDAKISAHPEWGMIRKFSTNEDFLFSEKEKDMMLGILFRQHPDNRMAYEYLMACTLLKKDVRLFPIYFGLNKNFVYQSIPKSYQEALLYNWGLSGRSFDSIPYHIDEKIRKSVENYAKIYTSMKEPEKYLEKDFSKSFLFYFHFRQLGKSTVEVSYQY